MAPLLLLLGTSIFYAQSVLRATQSEMTAVRKEAFRSNNYAARLAAKTLQLELQSYFDAIESEASRNELHQIAEELLSDTSVFGVNPSDGQRESSEVLDSVQMKTALYDSPKQHALQRYLRKRLEEYTNSGTASVRPRVATIFVTDASGTIVAIAYQQEVQQASDSTGKNFAYRTYFHGGPKDLPRLTETDGARPQALRRTHLSAPFKSTATNLWKVAVSTPIYFQKQDRAVGDAASKENAVSSPDGVLVITTNLGDFELMQSDSTKERLAVLVDARNGEHAGTLLQHPIMQSVERFSDDRITLSNDTLSSLRLGEGVDYSDPMAKLPGGEAFAGQWIAAMQPISLPTSRFQQKPPDESAASSELLMLVQYRISDIVG
ncbi:MAG: hypothetical protein AAFP69_23590, partial [Planctomycetota bacterium]